MLVPVWVIYSSVKVPPAASINLKFPASKMNFLNLIYSLGKVQDEAE